MNMIVRVLSADYRQKEAAGNGRWYLRGKISEADGEVLAVETMTEGEPTAEDIARINAEASAKNTELSQESVRREVASLKEQLAATDYKVIKNSEWAETQRALTGSYPNEGYPYEPQALYTERQALRDRINELENEDSDYAETCENAVVAEGGSVTC